MSTFPLGRWRVRRSGYGAMQLDGPFASARPPDPATAVGVLRAAVAAGVDHIDTAQYYGAVNDLVREALYPYPDQLAIVSKVAVGGGAGRPSGESHQLRAGIVDNLRSLRVDQLAAVNLRWLTGPPPVSAPAQRRSRCSGCCSLPPTCCSFPVPRPWRTCATTSPPRT